MEKISTKSKKNLTNFPVHDKLSEVYTKKIAIDSNISGSTKFLFFLFDFLFKGVI